MGTVQLRQALPDDALHEDFLQIRAAGAPATILLLVSQVCLRHWAAPAPAIFSSLSLISGYGLAFLIT